MFYITIKYYNVKLKWVKGVMDFNKSNKYLKDVLTFVRGYK